MPQPSFQLITRNRERHHPVPKVSAGRRAELRVQAQLSERLRDSPFEYYAGLRIPHRGRRREIDFVITTSDELWVVELKNWSGFVGLDGHNLVQHRAGGRGVVDHGPVVRELRKKRRAVDNLLERRIDEVPDSRAILVFFNRNVRIDEGLLAIDDVDVIRLPQLLSALPAPTSDKGPIGRFFSALFGDDDQKALPAAAEPVVCAREVLAELGTWDLLALHGGQIISGDLVDASTPELADRERFRRLRVDVPRSYFDLFRSEVDIEVVAEPRSDGEDESFHYGFDETIKFHCAGDPKPKEFALRDLLGVSFGYVDR